MKIFFRIVFVLYVFFLGGTESFAQITINNTLYTPTQLVDGVLVPSTSGTIISNVQFRGVYNSSNRYQVGYFSTATTTLAQLGFSNGIVLSTGNTSTIPLALGSNPRATQMATAYTSGTPGELRQTGTPAPPIIQDLDVLAGASNYFNGAILEFDFIPVENSVSFRYVFGSEEYSDNSGSINYQCSNYNDKFGFLISGPGISGGQGFSNDARNIARLGNGSEVSINSVNSGVVGSSGGAPSASNCLAANASWVQNTPTPEFLGTIDGTQLNGNTRILTATQTGLTPGQTYHIKLIITDVGDATYDSVVYLEAGSFTTEFSCDAGANQSLCDVTSTTLAAVSPATGTWSVISGSGTFVSNTDPNTIVNGLAPGANVLRWTASDLSCFSEVTINVNLSPAVPTITTTPADCSSAGVSTITNYNASNTYTFSPVGPTVGAGGVVSGMTVGTIYTVTASLSGCTSAASATFSIDPQLPPTTPTISTTAPTCSSAGVSTITNYSASNIYTFTPVGPTVGAGGIISGMTVGTSYTVTADNGICLTPQSASFSIAAQLPTPAVPAITTTPADCSSAGVSTITNYNTSNTYTFSPVGPTVGAGGVVSGMTVGTIYTVTASLSGCTSAASATFSIDPQLPPTTPTISTTAPTCSSAGVSTITNYSASNIYTFTPVGPTVGAGGLISGMTVGTSYTVTADNGICLTPQSASFSNAAQLPTPAVPTITTTPADCSSAGVSTITNYNASNTYTFSPVGPTVGAGGVVSGMTVGTIYTVTASLSGCTSAASATFSIDPQLPPTTPTISTTAPTCSSAGVSTITNYSASNIYTFTPVGPTVGAGGVISGMTVGTSYTVTADNGICLTPQSASFSIAAQLPTPAVPTITSVAATCSASGSSTISNYNASNTYTFSPVGPTVGAGGLISGMTFGTIYTVTASLGGCISTASASFSNAPQLSTPDEPTITSLAATCSSAGSSTISNYNASNTYTFSPVGPTVGAGGLISGMTFGTSYTVTATNGGCTSLASASFSNDAQLPTPTVPTITTTPADCSSAGSSTILNYIASNTYTFTPVGPTVGAGGLISGMTVGTSYTVTATNGGCTSAASASFSNAAQLPTPVVPTITSVAATCSAAGSSTISNYNASNTYTFSPVGPTVGAGGLISGMTVGTSYTVTATDGGCTSAASASFSNEAQLPTPAVPTITSVAADCSAAGSSTISNYNASNTYTFSPVGPTVGAGGLISGMTVGTSYTVTAINGGCTSAASASFSNAAQLPTPAVPTITSVAADCSASGSSTISNYNASNTYTFTPVGPTVGAGGLISGMTFGTSYTVTATNGGCTSAASASFSNDAQLESPSVSITHGCNGLDYELIASETINATYQWFDGNGNLIGSSPIIVIDNSDTYEVQVTLNGCMTNEYVTINNSFCSIPKGISPNNDGDNDSWDLSNLNIQKAQIFNRYGVEVYTKDNYTNEWEGRTNSGDELPTATYYYVLTFSNGTVKTGWVYLNRVN
ncbi:choice-of-anchor L domain-containing protein [Flavobacterium cyclinae]|uniref:choice-of-anchor L domain-containing protein n=1 Tax=Flavobacterium cyclinae TaxID=2895947 RepID=UPI001E3C8EAD|nr:choice-of-anchor L domain-containing protein [Flavobacterium cyclinae]UGS22274.1 gliding motility-associated C-terminal domain-containing protein [Flavobacterium cyclinae]